MAFVFVAVVVLVLSVVVLVLSVAVLVLSVVVAVVAVAVVAVVALALVILLSLVCQSICGLFQTRTVHMAWFHSFFQYSYLRCIREP
jgi:hypothetical protein